MIVWLQVERLNKYILREISMDRPTKGTFRLAGREFPEVVSKVVMAAIATVD